MTGLLPLTIDANFWSSGSLRPTNWPVEDVQRAADFRGGIQVWRGTVCTSAWRRLDGDELICYERIGNAGIAARFATTRVMVRALCSAALSVSPPDISFSKHPHGKPFVVGSAGLHFSVSHSGNVIIIALSDREVGIDIEDVRRDVSWAGIAHRVFSDEEWKRVLDRGEDLTECFAMWVAKEAVLKCTGEGIAGNLLECKSCWVDGELKSVDWNGRKFAISYFAPDKAMLGAVTGGDHQTDKLTFAEWRP